MSQDLMKKIEDAISKSENLANTGWKMVFGFRKTEVNSLAAAEQLKEVYAHRQEALAFWNNVDQTGKEMAEYGKRAKDALSKGDTINCIDFIYAAAYVEKQFESFSHIWMPIYQEAAKQAA